MKLTPKQSEKYKQAGYSHYVSYQRHSMKFDTWIKDGFPVTADSLEDTKLKLELHNSIVYFEVMAL